MFQNNPLLAQLKQQIKESIPKKEGTIKATDKGFGFLEIDNKTSIFIPPLYMKNVLHGDKVVALIRTEKEREVAEPDALLEPAITRFIARVKFHREKLFVVPDSPQLKEAIRAKTVKGLSHSQLAEGDWVVATLAQHPLSDKENLKGFACVIEQKITESEDKIAPWWVTLAKHNLPNHEPENQAHWQQLDEQLERQDLTHLPFITIDSESTQDMDDALHTVKNADGSFVLTIAIADPTSYIAPQTQLDQQARDRGFTIYLPGRNIPMLPRELSDDLCSLREGEVRPALCCQVTVAADGTIAADATFFAANIKSHARLAYNKISDWLTLDDAPWQPENDEIATQIRALNDFALARIQWRETHAVTFPDRPDYRFELSEDNDVIAIHTDERRIANRMVEEAMITANICAGRCLKDYFGFGIFNSHAGFAPEKMADVVSLVTEFGAITDAEKLATVEGFSALRRWLNQQPTSYLDSRVRKLQSYSETGNEPKPHFAMGLDVYATWTSPIRKYGDMVNHRLLKAMIRKDNQSDTPAPDSQIGDELALHRKHHRMAERDVADWLYVRLLRDAVEAQTHFVAEIFDINRGGMRVRLLENGASAFIPAPLILENKERLACNNELGIVTVDGDKVFQLGDQIEVVLAEIKEATRSIVAKPTREFAPVAVPVASDPCTE